MWQKLQEAPRLRVNNLFIFQMSRLMCAETEAVAKAFISDGGSFPSLEMFLGEGAVQAFSLQLPFCLVPSQNQLIQVWGVSRSSRGLTSSFPAVCGKVGVDHPFAFSKPGWPRSGKVRKGSCACLNPPGTGKRWATAPFGIPRLSWPMSCEGARELPPPLNSSWSLEGAEQWGSVWAFILPQLTSYRVRDEFLFIFCSELLFLFQEKLFACLYVCGFQQESCDSPDRCTVPVHGLNVLSMVIQQVSINTRSKTKDM